MSLKMEHYGLIFDHLGLAVKSPEKTVRFLRGLGYNIDDEVHDPLQKVNLLWCSSSHMPAVELVYSANTGDNNSPIDNILRNSSEIIYHQCYRSVDTGASIQAIKNDGIRVLCVSRMKSAILFGNKMVSFHMIAGFGLIEIIEE